MPIVRKQEKILSYYKENDNGEYELATDTTWPTDGYTFNTELSKCENGSELSWNNDNNAVILKGNVSDKCYLYFDITKPIPKITGVSNIYREGTFSIKDGYLTVTFRDEYDICNSTNYQVYIVDTNGTKSDNFNFQYTYTCFPAGTKILTNFGYKNIENIKINDIVLLTKKQIK